MRRSPVKGTKRDKGECEKAVEGECSTDPVEHDDVVAEEVPRDVEGERISEARVIGVQMELPSSYVLPLEVLFAHRQEPAVRGVHVLGSLSSGMEKAGEDGRMSRWRKVHFDGE